MSEQSYPVLNLLAKHRGAVASSSSPMLVRGVEVIQAIGAYGCLADLLPDTHTTAISEPIGERLPLTHHQLKDFLANSFDLTKFGIPKGARVSILLPNGPELALCVVSVVSNWCAAPINPTNTWEEIKAELESCKACAIIILAGSANDAALKAAEQLSLGVLVLNPSGSVTGTFRLVSLVPVNKSVRIEGYTSAKTVTGFTAFGHPETVLLLHTSGTSGTKKLVPYSLDMLITGVGSIICSWDLKPSDVCLNMMPLFHIGGIVRNIFSPLLSGGSVISCSGFDPILFWNVMSKQRVTWYYAAPTMHHAILMEAEKRDKPLPVSDVRFIANAAGGLLPVLAASLKSTFNSIILTSYGMTECMPISSPPQSYNLDPIGTSGMPVGPDVMIVDDSLTPLAPMQAGNILVRGPPCFGGYENSASATEESFCTVNGEPGWFNTGDMGYMDASKYLFISGRSKEIINRGGETISPFEIEEAVVQHPLVKETLAFSAPHATFQETIGVVIVSLPNKPRVDLPTLWKYLDSKLHRSKWPQIIVYMNSLPKNAAGKILRIRLGERMKLTDVDEESPPTTRLLEGTCPPVGTPLTASVAVEPVTVDLSKVEKFLLEQKGVLAASVVSVDLPFKPQSKVAFVVIKSDICTTDSLQEQCEITLNAYEVPLFVHAIPELPILASKEVDVNLLTDMAQSVFQEKSVVGPRNPMEAKIEKVWRQFLGSTTTVSVTESFFDLGGDSLKAGQLVNAMRKKLMIQISVADLFTSPTIEAMALKLSKLKIIGSPNLSAKSLDVNDNPAATPDSPLLSSNHVIDPEAKYGQSWEHSSNLSATAYPCLFFQLVPLLVVYPFRRIIIWFVVAAPWVYLMNTGVNRFDALVLAMIIARLLLGIFAPLFGILFKWIVIGRYRAGRYPLWGAMYLKWWIVEQVINIMGKGFFRDDIPIIGPHLVRLYYVMMGAQIGNNVKIHKDAKLGQADLLSIGDDVVIDNGIVRPFSIEEGHFVLLPITVGDRCSIGVKTSVAGGAVLASGTCLGPLSSSYETEDSEAHYRDYARPGFLAPPAYLIVLLGIPIMLMVLAVSYLPWYFGLKIMVRNAKLFGWYDGDISTIYLAFHWWVTPERLFYYFLLRTIRRCLVPPLKLFAVILIKRLIVGKFEPMDALQKQTPWNRFRYWLMNKLLPGGGLGGVARLVGTHYEVISIIYRMLGAKIGKHVYWPGSGLDLVEYDLLEVGDDVVFGSRSVILTSTRNISAKVVLEAGSMVADRCVILPGVTLGRGAVLGSGSLAAENMKIPVGSVWVGSRAGSAINVAPTDMSYNFKDTLTPFGRAFYNRDANYFVIPLWVIIIYNTLWQAVCTCIRNCPTPLALFLCKYLLDDFGGHYDTRNVFELFQITLFAVIPVHATLCLLSLLIDITGKWLLMGRRKEGAYPWDTSSYCQRWQIYLTLQEIRRGERSKTGILDMLEGSQYLVWYFRMLGARIGKNVCLYPNGGDPMLTEPDMVTIEDNACVDDASLIAHINTRGIFRLNPLVVGKGSVLKSSTRLLSGSSMESRSILLEHTLVLAGESVEAGTVWQGWPSSSQVPLETHRARVKALLDKSLRFRYADTERDTEASPKQLRRVSHTPTDKAVKSVRWATNDREGNGESMPLLSGDKSVNAYTSGGKKESL